ncbi:hypothetical protein KCH_73460 [Kitasatospora cheerisanensis KCTC 2395]|uniref:Uncharacterized protein n=1 Tax=Kitasatospora cheerisanensis KCTC 2395 TaxID=1348663 RepID=A0A066YRY4_9ACTN|nr:hypothetical protein KCH_73460 [Kitasatospora cheerisanensis KCTC 2395]
MARRPPGDARQHAVPDTRAGGAPRAPHAVRGDRLVLPCPDRDHLRCRCATPWAQPRPAAARAGPVRRREVLRVPSPGCSGRGGVAASH